jgi:hypothetical protein
VCVCVCVCVVRHRTASGNDLFAVPRTIDIQVVEEVVQAQRYVS